VSIESGVPEWEFRHDKRGEFQHDTKGENAPPDSNACGDTADFRQRLLVSAFQTDTGGVPE
jgi:hypothetical protein